MKYLNGNYYVEVRDDRYRIHPTENIILPILHYLSELNIKSKMRLRSGRIRKYSKMITIK